MFLFNGTKGIVILLLSLHANCKLKDASDDKVVIGARTLHNHNTQLIGNFSVRRLQAKADLRSGSSLGDKLMKINVIQGYSRQHRHVVNHDLIGPIKNKYSSLKQSWANVTSLPLATEKYLKKSLLSNEKNESDITSNAFARNTTKSSTAHVQTNRYVLNDEALSSNRSWILPSRLTRSNANNFSRDRGEEKPWDGKATSRKLEAIVPVHPKTHYFAQLLARSMAPIFSILSFWKEKCWTTGYEQGTCYTVKECHVRGGRSHGICAGGFGACCVFSYTCDSSSALNRTYFVNAEYPFSVSKYGATCEHSIRNLDGICQIRLDFDEFYLEPPGPDGICWNDAFAVLGIDVKLPPLCGDLTGHHVYLPVGFGPTISYIINLGGESPWRKWKIRTTKLKCTSASLAPGGCLQNFQGMYGRLASFNYREDGGPLSSPIYELNYGVCVRREKGVCAIRWTRCRAGGFGSDKQRWKRAAEPTELERIQLTKEEKFSFLDKVPGKNVTNPWESTINSSITRVRPLQLNRGDFKNRSMAQWRPSTESRAYDTNFFGSSNYAKSYRADKKPLKILQKSNLQGVKNKLSLAKVKGVLGSHSKNDNKIKSKVKFSKFTKAKPVFKLGSKKKKNELNKKRKKKSTKKRKGSKKKRNKKRKGSCGSVFPFPLPVALPFPFGGGGGGGGDDNSIEGWGWSEGGDSIISSVEPYLIRIQNGGRTRDDLKPICFEWEQLLCHP